MSRQRAQQLLRRVREIAERSERNPDRKREAQECIALLERLILHGGVAGNPNLSERAILRRAQGLVWEWDERGPLLDPVSAEELAVQIWGRTEAGSRSNGARRVRAAARRLFPGAAPGKGGQWVITQEMAAAIRNELT